VVVLVPQSGRRVRVPWAAVLAPPPRALVGDLRLSAASFRPSDDAPAVLTFQAGRVVEERGRERVFAVDRLDVELWTTGAEPRSLGVLARLRNLLPGRYAFGLTGRGPAGQILRPGRYRLRIVALPTEPAPASSASVWFAVT
jgi:hypothetical protein